MAPVKRTVAMASWVAAARELTPRSLAFLHNDAVSLSQASAQVGTSATSAGTARVPVGASFFDSFYQGESNYDVEADRNAWQPVGWELKPDDPNRENTVVKAIFYHESPSGGSREAWQTHFPAVTGGPAGHPESPVAWKVNQGGNFAQEYQVAKTPQMGSIINAPWFESSTGQYDGWGRAKSPIAGAPKLYLEGYQERSVNTTLTCKEAGCEAYTFLQAYDGSREVGRDCKLSLYLHPTDFDDQYSGERLSYIRVNGVTVNTDCFPMVSGCNVSAQLPMFSCLQELPLDNIIDSSGFLNVSAQISDAVDECPYRGNLLSAVPLVTCLVAQKPPSATPLPPDVGGAVPMVRTPHSEGNYFNIRVPLQCPLSGCEAKASMAIGPETRKRVSNCILNMKVYQTDFDNEENTLETIEYIEIDGYRVASNMRPGKNPCREQWAGRTLSLAEKEHTAIQDFDVTENATNGLVSVVAKISDHVDECAHDGYLLNGIVDINCSLTSPPPPDVRTRAPPAVLSNTSNTSTISHLTGDDDARPGMQQQDDEDGGRLAQVLLQRKREPREASLRAVLAQNLRR